MDVLPKRNAADAHVRHYYHIHLYQQFGRHQALIVSHNENVRKSLCERFSHSQYDVDSANTVEVTYLQLLRKNYNMLVLDASLPSINELRRCLHDDPDFSYLLIICVTQDELLPV